MTRSDGSAGDRTFSVRGDRVRVSMGIAPGVTFTHFERKFPVCAYECNHPPSTRPSVRRHGRRDPEREWGKNKAGTGCYFLLNYA